MAVQLASKYSGKVVERFKIKSVITGASSDDYDWVGVNSVNVYSRGTAPLVDYVREGNQRYGQPTEVDTTVQNLALTRDRAFAKTIDRRNKDETMGVLKAGEFMADEMDEVITPEIDIYALAVLNTAITANSAFVNTGATSALNAYTNFLAAATFIRNRKAGQGTLTAWMSGAYYAFLKGSNFIVDSEDSAKSRHNGNLGQVDGIDVRVIPDTYFVSGTDLIIADKSSWIAPVVLESMVTHTNPPGINGWLIEGRVVYDAFVFAARIDGISGHKAA